MCYFGWLRNNTDFTLSEDAESICFAASSGEYQFIVRKDGYRFISEIIPESYNSLQIVLAEISESIKNGTLDSWGDGLDSIMNAFGKWVRFVISEIQYEGVWGEYSAISFSSVDISGSLTEKFTDEEAVILRQKIENLRAELSTYGELKEVLTQINVKLDVLGELVSELPKVDWKDHAIGAIIGLAFDKICSIDEVKEILSNLMSFVTEPLAKYIE